MQLGLCNPPEPIYLYVKQGEDKGENYLWYKYRVEEEKTIPVYEKGLCGTLVALRLTSKEYKGKPTMKLDIVVQAEEVYVIRTGIDTNFAKTFLLALYQVTDISRPLIFAVAPGDENVVFCRLYDATTKQRVKATWEKNADWATLISTAQHRLGQDANEPEEEFAIQAPPEPISRDDIMHNIDQLMTDKGVSVDQARDMIKRNFNCTSRRQMTIEQLQKLEALLKEYESPTAAIAGF